ncbi:hypothetical protein JYU34_014855 [Plutella xylostella]|uniref:EGF-like domain-containing protein n=1 Tax=Plutella xylostella TaxID=51655 RepID=A0ABQ7Q9E3_PLUXY|nr:hypothetical protein JYU34_014855 [Plutella xylostella]
MFWTDLGPQPGIYRASLSGTGARLLAAPPPGAPAPPAPAPARRLRRPAALALDAPARRLYFYDDYYGTLETVRLDGTQRALRIVAGRGNNITHYNVTAAGATSPGLPHGCTRLAVWGERVLCAHAHGLLATDKRRRGAPLQAAGAALHLVDIHIMHPALYTYESNPCLAERRCAGGAVCVPSSDNVDHATCLCPDQRRAKTSEDGSVRCVSPSSPVPAAPPAPAAPACPPSCGGGACVVSGGVASCRCQELYSGPRCETYRCADYCRRGRCELDAAGPRGPDGKLPLKCICPAGRWGARCELSAPAPAPATAPPGPLCAGVRCENGGACRVQHDLAECVCAPGFVGARCEQCADAAPCPAGGVCRRRAGGVVCEAPATHCSDELCGEHGTCVEVNSTAACSCAAGWAGARCDLPDATHEARGHELCTPDRCLHGGSCVLTAPAAGAAGDAGDAVCACAGGWGGARCGHYVGRDHACDAAACAAPTICVWAPGAGAGPGAARCACPLGAPCAPPAPAHAALWLGAAALIAVLLAVAAVVYHIYRKSREGLFGHSRLADNVEISNPMYLAGEELEPEPYERHKNGGNHFANPVYESMYSPERATTEEHATLLEEGSGSPPPAERAALL